VLKVWLLRFAIVFAVYFALQGGEYSTSALFRQRNREQTLTRMIDSLQRDIDSLRTLKRLIETDPATQERIAREDFGMIRDKELLFRFLDPDSLKRKSDSRKNDSRR
jgi:cell division protein FtsB